jgi:hypothetical protein
MKVRYEQDRGTDCTSCCFETMAERYARASEAKLAVSYIARHDSLSLDPPC